MGWRESLGLGTLHRFGFRPVLPKIRLRASRYCGQVRCGGSNAPFVRCFCESSVRRARPGRIRNYVKEPDAGLCQSRSAVAAGYGGQAGRGLTSEAPSRATTITQEKRIFNDFQDISDLSHIVYYQLVIMYLKK
jgi:hypothetical protein